MPLVCIDKGEVNLAAVVHKDVGYLLFCISDMKVDAVVDFGNGKVLSYYILVLLVDFKGMKSTSIGESTSNAYC